MGETIERLLFLNYFENVLMEVADKISKDWIKIYPDEPMDCDEVDECTDIIKNRLNYLMGNTTDKELMED